VAADQLDGTLADVLQPQQRPAGGRRLAVRLEDEVRRDAEARREARAEAILGDVRDTGADRGARVAASDRATADEQRPFACGAEAGDRLGQLALTVARDACDRDDLALAHLERRAAHRGVAAIALRPDVLEP